MTTKVAVAKYKEDILKSKLNTPNYRNLLVFATILGLVVFSLICACLNENYGSAIWSIRFQCIADLLFLLATVYVVFTWKFYEVFVFYTLPLIIHIFRLSNNNITGLFYYLIFFLTVIIICMVVWTLFLYNLGKKHKRLVEHINKLSLIDLFVSSIACWSICFCFIRNLGAMDSLLGYLFALSVLFIHIVFDVGYIPVDGTEHYERVYDNLLVTQNYKIKFAHTNLVLKKDKVKVHSDYWLEAYDYNIELTREQAEKLMLYYTVKNKPIIVVDLNKSVILASSEDEE